MQRERDPTLVRHIYDLHAIRAHYDPVEVAILAREIMQADADTYGRQFPAYRDNPLAETLRAAAGIAADAGFAASYATFRRDMAYGGGAGIRDGDCHLGFAGQRNRKGTELRGENKGLRSFLHNLGGG